MLTWLMTNPFLLILIIADSRDPFTYKLEGCSKHFLNVSVKVFTYLFIYLFYSFYFILLFLFNFFVFWLLHTYSILVTHFIVFNRRKSSIYVVICKHDLEKTLVKVKIINNNNIMFSVNHNEQKSVA